jgi:hypothetical protein
MIKVAATYHTTELNDAEVDAICIALTNQANQDIGKAWGLAPVSVGRHRLRAEEWHLVFLEDSDQAGALGYHNDETPYGLPLMKVFTRDCYEDGVAYSACASHELAESLVDPFLRRCETDEEGKAWAAEIGDPAQSSTYEISGIEVQDFVTPAWFNPTPPTGSKFDHTGKIKRPFEVPQGGYAQWTSDLQSWHEIGMELGAGHTRPERRKKRLK